ncbi:glycerophosphodiester phosphodiesterase family protein [Paracoccus salsus]|uniref:glycerophosphodiester phosphodiesterase family protein n=1 Tax=Paracoccus salsus TaxID=2911061 RepID=UPI001F180155|nr:glycerophosphodiester phosphodiesterase family protein [Paracoccus salsus]MCF3972959.1 phosphodiesterase [Paracoccus salsus]
MAALPSEFIRIPIAHRGLHGKDIPENSLAAAQAAIEAGYGIEIDVQPAADDVPMVFHDYDLARLAGEEVFIADIDSDELAERRLLTSAETIPTLAALLRLVEGRVPLLIEIKDQDGRLGPHIGDLHRHVADQLKAYEGPVAVMSFNPHVVKAFHERAPEIPVGITSCGFPAEDWPALDAETRRRLADIDDFPDTGACFISHDRKDLANLRVDALKAQGVPVLCWTVRSAEQETAAREVADNITFEGYRPDV